MDNYIWDEWDTDLNKILHKKNFEILGQKDNLEILLIKLKFFYFLMLNL